MDVNCLGHSTDLGGRRFHDQYYVIMFVSVFLADWWFSPVIPVSSTHKTDHHYIAEILLKVALNTINQLNQSTYL